MRLRLPAVLCVFALACASSANAAILNFDDLVDNTTLTTYGGATFTNAVAVAAGLTLNEFEFPPASGDVVILDLTGPIRIDFATPVKSVSALVTYGVPVTLRIFSASNTLLGSVTSLFNSNMALSGDTLSTPNEALGLSLAGFDIAYAEFTGDSTGASFTLDDLTFEERQAVPEPASLALLACGLGYVASRRRH